jgi:hypothetical protein
MRSLAAQLVDRQTRQAICVFLWGQTDKPSNAQRKSARERLVYAPSNRPLTGGSNKAGYLLCSTAIRLHLQSFRSISQSPSFQRVARPYNVARFYAVQLAAEMHSKNSREKVSLCVSRTSTQQRSYPRGRFIQWQILFAQWGMRYWTE